MTWRYSRKLSTSMKLLLKHKELWTVELPGCANGRLDRLHKNQHISISVIQLVINEKPILKKRELEIRRKNLSSLIECKSQMQIEKNLIVREQIMRRVWHYRAELWECSRCSNKYIIQRFPNEIL